MTRTNTAPTITAVNNGYFSTSSVPFEYRGYTFDISLHLVPATMMPADEEGGMDLELCARYFDLSVRIPTSRGDACWEVSPEELLSANEYRHWTVEATTCAFFDVDEPYTPKFCSLVALMCDRFLDTLLDERLLLAHGIDPDLYQDVIDGVADRSRGN